MRRRHILSAILLVLLFTLCCAACACAAQVRPIPVNHDRLDTDNGEFRLSFRGTGRIGDSGYFSAVLFPKSPLQPLSLNNINIPVVLFTKVPGMFFILRQVSKTNGIETQRKPGIMPGFRFPKKCTIRRRKRRGC